MHAERAFSVQNMIKTKRRNGLRIAMLSNLMMISIEGPRVRYMEQILDKAYEWWTKVVNTPGRKILGLTLAPEEGEKRKREDEPNREILQSLDILAIFSDLAQQKRARAAAILAQQQQRQAQAPLPRLMIRLNPPPANR